MSTSILRPSRAVLGMSVSLAILGVGLTACGGGSKSSAASSAANQGTSSNQLSAPRTLPGAFGTIAALTSTSMQIQNAQSGQIQIDYGSSTTISQEKASKISDVKVGDCVVIQGSPSTTNATTALTATRVQISEPVSGSCSAGFGPDAVGGGFGGGFGGRGGFGGARPSGAPRPNRSPRAGFGNGGRGFQIAVATGKVTAASASSITVSGTLRTGANFQRRTPGATPSPQPTPTTTTITATPSSTTTYTSTLKTAATALKLGQCVSAVGKADDTGIVAASSVTIFATTATCTAATRFGGGGNV